MSPPVRDRGVTELSRSVIAAEHRGTSRVTSACARHGVHLCPMRHIESTVLSEAELARLDAYWRAANYLTVGQIYLRGNARLERPLTVADIKPRLLGHW